MTVSSSFTDKVYAIDGTTTRFPWNQDLDEQYGSLVVTEETESSNGLVVKTYVEGTDYNIEVKDVVFVTAPSDTSHYIRITRNTYKGQPVVFNEGEDFPAEDFENSLDRLAMVAQELTMSISKEQTARENADTALQESINSEAGIRANADTILDGKITAEKNRAEGVEGSLSNLATTAKTNLVSAINEVDSGVDTINGTLATFGNIVTHNVDEFSKPSDVGNATLTIKKNSTSVGTFTANSKTDTDINLIIPTSAADVDALPNTTKYGSSISLSLDSSTYILTIQLKDQNGSALGTAATVNLPLGSVVVNGSYDSVTKSIILVLANGNTITIPVADLVSGLQTEITSSNMLDADLVDDSTSANKFVTSSEKSTWNGKQNAIDSSHKLSADLVDDTSATNKFVTASEKTAWNGKQDALTFDSTPTQGSTNPVTSGGLYDIIGDVVTLINAL